MDTRSKGSPARMVLAGVVANLPGLSAGLSMGFSAILIPQLQQPGAEIRATLEQGSWIASLFVIGDLLGCVIGGPIADRFGRRVAILVDCLPLCVGWLLTWQARSLAHLYLARCITGVGIGAGVPIASIYLREISTPELRGTLTILMPAAANTGNLVMYLLGWLLPWRLTCLPGALLPLLPAVLVLALPETPAWLLARGERRKAVATLCTLRGVSDPSLVEPEIAAMEVAAKLETSSAVSCVTWRQKAARLLDRGVVLPMALLVFLFFTQSFSGSNMVSYYTVTILQMADIPLDEHISAILVAAQYVVGYALSSVLVTRLGRRTLLMASLLLMMLANLGAGLVLLGRRPHQLPANTTTDLAIVEADTVLAGEAGEAGEAGDSRHSVLSFVPVISCVLITFGYACGLGPVPFILFGELFPSSVRGSATSITAFLRSITVFLSIKIFPSLLWLCGIGGSFLSCALVCGGAVVISFLCVPETRGMDLEQLESIYKRQPEEPRSPVSLDTSESLLSSSGEPAEPPESPKQPRN